MDDKGERMRDVNGRYILSGEPDGLLDDADYVILYNSTPIPFSINNTLTWKNWDANIYIYGSLRGRKINDVKHQSVYGLEDITYGVNVLTDVMDRWRPDHQDGSMPVWPRPKADLLLPRVISFMKMLGISALTTSP